MATFVLRCTLVALAAAVTNCAVPSREPGNLSLAKKQVERYVDDGSYQRELASVSANADAWIRQRAASAHGAKLAVVFDIDETVLSNLPHMREQDWGYDPEVWGRWVERSRAPALESVRAVYRTAVANDVTVFFITGRKDYEKTSTARNLRSQGMGRYAGLVVKPSSFPAGKSAVDFKAPQRALIEQRGYRVIASIGDQQSDLDGGHAEKTFKLPNPFYFIP
jgi:acid phosphatase